MLWSWREPCDHQTISEKDIRHVHSDRPPRDRRVALGYYSANVVDAECNSAIPWYEVFPNSPETEAHNPAFSA